ncbi:hypothetical protein GDO78_016718 [Eleutherodactylus coqui]|uniref:Uncharacterized protein n=2 Tax=Eleutherodactylus coqui TaxID=57060 RepID=A0A8J6BRA4_ELECQ|nr:hypothetical protein GDO78_016718 [Eleutherodactylus coqui]
MECDFCFEDSVFSETRERAAQRGQSYTAKQCEPQWFHGGLSSDDVVEVHTILKFRADLSYRQEDFEKAFKEYSECSALIPPGNNAMKRDVQESQARCLIHLGRPKEALEITQMLTKGVSNTDHLTGVLHLQATIHNHLGNLQEEVSCLQQLIALHPFNPHFWICLAECYMSLFLAISNCKEPSQSSHRFSLCPPRSLGAQRCMKDIARTIDCSVCRDDNLLPRHCNASDSSLTIYTSEEQLLTWSCTSFIRARLLLQFIQPQHASFVLENNLKTQELIEGLLEKVGLLEEQKMLIVEVMGEDLLVERTKEEGQTDIKTTQTLNSFIMTTDTDFKVRWFQKITSLGSQSVV